MTYSFKMSRMKKEDDADVAGEEALGVELVELVDVEFSDELNFIISDDGVDDVW